MSVRSNATAVGAFVLGALAIAVGIAVVFGSGAAVQGRQALRHLLRGLARGARRSVPRSSIAACRSAQVVDDHAARSRWSALRRHPGGHRADTRTRSRASRRAQDHGHADRAGAARAAGAGEPDHRPALVELNIFPGTPIREVPNTDRLSLRSPRYLRCRSGLQQTLSDLVANRPKLAKGIDQMLELLNYHDRRRRCREPGQGRAARWPSWPIVLADPKGPLLETLGQLPALMARCSSHRSPPCPALVQQARSRRWLRSTAWSAAPDAPVAKTLADLQATLVATRSSASS